MFKISRKSVLLENQVFLVSELVAEPDGRRHQLWAEVLRRFRRQQPRRRPLQRDQVSPGGQAGNHHRRRKGDQCDIFLGMS